MSLASDPVPNVRFGAASALETLLSRVDKDTKENKIRPVLEALMEDKDADVRLYAVAALKNL